MQVVLAPIGHMYAHQRFDDFPMIRQAQKQERVRDDEILNPRFLISPGFGKSDEALRRARAPFAGHTLPAHDTWLDFRALRPVLDPFRRVVKDVAGQ